MKKLLIAFGLALTLLAGCRKRVDTQLLEEEHFTLFEVHTNGYISHNKAYEVFNEEVANLYESNEFERPVVVTLIEKMNSGDYQHTITAYYSTDTMARHDLSNMNEPIKFSDYRNLISVYSEDEAFPNNRTAVDDETVPLEYIQINGSLHNDPMFEE